MPLRAPRKVFGTAFPLFRFALIMASVVVIIASAGLLVAFVVFEGWSEEYTAGAKPVQFYRGLDADLLDDYAGIFGIAHNSGDSLRATRQALAHGADIIEIDVVSLGGELYAGHASPLPLVGSRVFRGPRLAEVWKAAGEADAIKLDLKESSARFLDLLFDFVNQRQGQPVMVVSRNAEALRVAHDKAPQVLRSLSVPSKARLNSLKQDEALLAILDGVTIQQRLLDEDTAAWLKERNLIVFTWTVNDLARVNELVRYGIDGIITDNLAIMELLGGQERGEATLERRAMQ